MAFLRPRLKFELTAQSHQSSFTAWSRRFRATASVTSGSLKDGFIKMSNRPQSNNSRTANDGMNFSADAAGADGVFTFNAYNPGLGFAAGSSGFQQPAFQPAIQPSYSKFSAVSSTPTAPTVAAPTTVSATSSTTTTGTTAPTALPAWVSTLQTASIAADMAAADVNGTVTYAGLQTLLTDLDSKLSSSKTTLTSAEMADLKTIVTNLNNGMSTSAYLTNIMKSLVNGNAANATWTGG